MGKIVVPEVKSLLSAMNLGGTGKVCPYPVPVLVCGKNLVYGNGDDFPCLVPETKPNGRDFPVCVRAKNHLYGDVNTKYAFQENHILSAINGNFQSAKARCSLIISHRTYVCNMRFLEN